MRDYKKKTPAKTQATAEHIYLFQGVLRAESLNKLKLPQDAQAFVMEGRPSLEAGRRNSGILLGKGTTPTVISDNMAGFLFFKGLVKQVFLACQYADNKGALCDTGALILAVLAKKHRVPVKLLAAEHRTRFLGDPKDILSFEGQAIAPAGTQGFVPLVEWVAAEYLK